MKNITEMNYQELVIVGIQLNSLKNETYFIPDLKVFEGHLCRTVMMGEYQVMGDETPVGYLDVLSGDYVGATSIFASVPAFLLVLTQYGISVPNMRAEKEELAELWSRYQELTNNHSR